MTRGSDWTGTSMQNLAVRMPGMKDMMEEAAESCESAGHKEALAAIFEVGT